MTTIQRRVAQMIADATGMRHFASSLAEDLADAGLLAPEPEVITAKEQTVSRKRRTQ